MSKKGKIILPKQKYGPFFLKILREFMTYHEIIDLDLIEPTDNNAIILSKIATIMCHSLPENQRNLLFKESEEYNESFLPNLRN